MDAGPLTVLGDWNSKGAFRGAHVVMMLDASQRQLITVERPAVPNAELTEALRWPVAAALELPPDQVLFDAAELPALNDSGKAQLLLACASRSRVQTLQGLLRKAAIQVECVDVADMALRNAVLMQADISTPHVVIGATGGELLVGLIAEGELCAVRNLPLNAVDERALADMTDRLVLHVQRTIDLFERQITRFSISGTCVLRDGLPPSAASALEQALPGHIRMMSVETMVDTSGLHLGNAMPDNRVPWLAALASARLERREPGRRAP
jgi:MSHA biogenesis protein MshI